MNNQLLDSSSNQKIRFENGRAKIIHLPFDFKQAAYSFYTAQRDLKLSPSESYEATRQFLFKKYFSVSKVLFDDEHLPPNIRDVILSKNMERLSYVLTFTYQKFENLFQQRRRNRKNKKCK